MGRNQGPSRGSGVGAPHLQNSHGHLHARRKQRTARSARRHASGIRRQLPHIRGADGTGRRGAEPLVMNAADPPWIFIHVQKTGGNAVRSALGMSVNDAHKHLFARELRGIYGGAAWDSRFKFAFVRNPWDRLVSWWSMIDNSRALINRARPPNSFFGYLLAHARNFEEFILRC